MKEKDRMRMSELQLLSSTILCFGYTALTKATQFTAFVEVGILKECKYQSAPARKSKMFYIMSR
jgi:hypothetical protein